MDKPNPFIVQVNETTQVRVRLAEYRGRASVYIQQFFKPAPDSDWASKALPDGYCYGKAATLPPAQTKQLLFTLIRFCMANGFVKKAELHTFLEDLKDRAPQRPKTARPRPSPAPEDADFPE